MNVRAKYLVLVVGVLMGVVVPVSASLMNINTTADGDGQITNSNSINSPYHTARNYTTGAVDKSGTEAGYAMLRGGATEDYIYSLVRTCWEFNTSTIPDDATVTGAKLRLHLFGKDYGMGKATYSVTGFYPATNGTLASGDFDNFGSSVLSNNVTYDSATAGSYVNFTITDPTAISTTGWTNYMVRDTWDIDDDGSQYSWANLASSYLRFRTSEYGDYLGDTTTPTLEITYTATPDADFSANITYGKGTPNGMVVHFTDTSLHDPTSWSWAYKNETVGWTVFSTSQNPTYSFPVGVYDINLTATNLLGSSDEIKTSYIQSRAGYPTTNFTSDNTTGNYPFLVQFTDTSDVTNPTGWAWVFGDGNTSSLQNPTNTYSLEGSYSVSLNVTNASGYEKLTKSNYILTTEYIAPRTHPFTFNVKQTEQYRTYGASATSYTPASSILTSANTGLSYNFYGTGDTTYGTINGGLYRNPRAIYALSMAIIYQINGDTRYANKTVEALLNLNKMATMTQAQQPGRFEDQSLGDMAIAYDLIYPTLGVNSTLDSSNNTVIRDLLAYRADRSYRNLNDFGTDWYSTNIETLPYSQAAVAIMGEVLYDYENATLATIPKNWRRAGTFEGLFVDDVLHSDTEVATGAFTMSGYNPTSAVSSVPNGGSLARQNNATSGWSFIGTYKYYDMYELYQWFHIYANIYKHPIWDTYPSAYGKVMEEAMTNMPNHYVYQFGTDGNVVRPGAELLWKHMNESSRAFSKYHIEGQATSGSSVSPPNASSVLPMARTLPSPFSAQQNFLMYESYNNESATPPSQTNFISPSNWRQIIRGSWDTRSDWVTFFTQNEPDYRQTRWSTDEQLSIGYYSKGDLLLSDSGEIKELVGSGSPWAGIYGAAGVQHNVLAFGNGTGADFPLSVNVSYQTAEKSNRLMVPAAGGVATHGLSAYTLTPVNVNTLVDTPYITYIDGRLTARVFRGSTTDSIPFKSPITHTRAIMYPLKDYVIVLDSATSTGIYDFVNVFRFTSFNEVLTTSTAPAGFGHVIGNLSIGGSDYDWLSQPINSERITGYSTNSIIWDTTNPYDESVSLELFTSPTSPVNYITHPTSIGGYSVSTEVKSPVIFLKPNESTSLYRVTALLSRYVNETPRVAAELTVTGTGSAIRVNSSDGQYRDYIYTGTGTSNFSTFQTNAETVFIRSNATATYALIVNGSSLKYGATDLINNASVQPYIEYLGGTLGETFPPVANFTATPLTGTAAVAITFTDTSTGATSWQWAYSRDSGNWTNFSATQNPVAVFSVAGLYSINLTATNAAGSDDEVKLDYINVSAAPVAAPTSVLSGMYQSANNQSMSAILLGWLVVLALIISGFFIILFVLSGGEMEITTIALIVLAIGAVIFVLYLASIILGTLSGTSV